MKKNMQNDERVFALKFQIRSMSCRVIKKDDIVHHIKYSKLIKK